MMIRHIVYAIAICLAVQEAHAFNLSPQPNIVFREPRLRMFQEKTKSSYFGMTITLRKNSVFIGAPKAQSSLEKQRNINETGAIYKCRFDTAECTPYNLDPNGNKYVERRSNTYDSEKKDFQLMGWSMDGRTTEDDSLVACAPKLVADINENYYLLNGVCYLSQNTKFEQPPEVIKIAPMRATNLQQTLARNLYHYYYIYGEQGFSVHVADNDEILIGAPGILTWRGSVIRYRVQNENFGALSRRDNTQPERHQADNLYYVSDIPNPTYTTDLGFDAYFGYAVSSGFFDSTIPDKLLYVASAPQASLQTGEVRIFDIVDFNTEKMIDTKYVFSGQQMGEYFGYALLTDDFNNDGLPDLAIAAPMHSKESHYENGIVYVYENKDKLDFGSARILSSSYESNGRFGTSLARIGDINSDGFNDIAIGAPFENNGVVYIFLGSSNGLAESASQRLEAPGNNFLQPDVTTSIMFGHGLSRGVDIDNNGYNDIAIGAPNSEAVYVYKSYPVVNIISRIILSNKTLPLTESVFTVTACYRYETKKPLLRTEFGFSIELKLDPHHGRATTIQTFLNVLLSEQDKCFDFLVQVKPVTATIFQPIELDFHHDLIDAIPKNSKFCDKCVVLDPSKSRVRREKVAFNTGCKTSKCISDLQIQSKLLNIKVPYIIGSTRTIMIQYDIQNLGETAYLTQISIFISNTTKFSRIPSNCRLALDDSLVCDLANGGPFEQYRNEKLFINIDTTQITGTSIEVRAIVSSHSDELNEANNQVLDIIPIQEFSEIEIFGRSSKEQIALIDGHNAESISHVFEIRNNGPTKINELTLAVSFPTTFVLRSGEILNIIEVNNVTVMAQYNGRLLDVSLNRDDSILIQNAEEKDFTFEDEVDLANSMPKNDSDAPNELLRKRRAAVDRQYNFYTQTITESPHQHVISARSLGSISDNKYRNIPGNQTIPFNCDNDKLNTCIQARMKVNRLVMGNEPILIVIKFGVDLNVIKKVIKDSSNIFVIESSIDVMKTGDPEKQTIKVVKTNPFTIISQNPIKSTPIWIYIASSLLGLLLLILISFGMYKLGFFKRQTRDDLQRLTKESTNASTESVY